MEKENGQFSDCKVSSKIEKMKELHFSKKYFKKEILDDPDAGIRVVIKEKPCIEIPEEEYSLRILTRYEDSETVHRNWAIEHHLPPAKHSFPHLQFKFHTEEIGQFRIRIDVANQDEYKKAILGFIYQIKNILNELERFRKGVTNEILVLELVNKLKPESYFLNQKIQEGIKKYTLEFDKGINRGKIKNLGNHHLLLAFVGEENAKLIKDSYSNN